MSSLRVGRRRSAILPTLVIVAVLIVAFAIFTSVWTDRLWYGSFGYASVFSTMLLTRIGLFVAFGLIMATCVVANAAIAYRLRPRLGAQMPSSPLLERYRETAGVQIRLGAGRHRCRRWPVRRRCRQRPRAGIPGLAQRDSRSTSPTRGSGLTSGSSSSPIRGGGSSCRSPSPRWSSVRSWRPSCTTRWAACGSADHGAAAAGPPRLTSRSWSVWPSW